MEIERELINQIVATVPKSEVAVLHRFALGVADAMKGLIMELWRGGSFDETLKEDKTPVTVIDLKAEELARAMISKQFPDHGIIGEEFDPINPESDFQWTVDPIDGTQNLVNRIPTFGTLIGVRYKGQAILGVIDHPVLNLRTSGGIGIGVVHNGAKLALADIDGDQLSPHDIIATNSLAVFGRSVEAEKQFARVMSFHPHARIYYDCYAQTLAILGSLAVVVEPGLKIWDITPCEALLAELGGGCVKFGEVPGVPSKMLVNAVFGKRKAVQWMCSHLEIVPSSL